MIKNNMYSSYIGINNAFFHNNFCIISNRARHLTIILTLSVSHCQCLRVKSVADCLIRHLDLFKYGIIINIVQKHFAKFNALFLFSVIKIAKIKSREIWLRQNREIKYARK